MHIHYKSMTYLRYINSMNNYLSWLSGVAVKKCVIQLEGSRFEMSIGVGHSPLASQKLLVFCCVLNMVLATLVVQKSQTDTRLWQEVL